MCYVSENNCLQIVPTAIITLVHLMSSKLGLINAKIIIMIMMMTLTIFIIILIEIITTIIETIIIIIIHTAHIFVHQPLGLFQAFRQQSAEENSRRQKKKKKKKTHRALLSEGLEQGIRSHSILYTKPGFHAALRAFSIHTGVDNSRCTLTPKDIDNTVIVIKQLPLTLIKVAGNFVGSFGWGRNL